MSDVFRPAAGLVMGPITGVRPNDNRWGGEMPEEYVTAIYDDVIVSDLPPILEKMPKDASIEEILGVTVIQTIVRTAQRIAVELDGCQIDTTTIFEDELNG